MKKCSSCKGSLPFSEFSKNRAAKDGYQNTCKHCQAKAEDAKGIISKEDAKIWYESTLEEFTCNCCGKTAKASEFYYKRSHGRVKIVTTRCRECEKDKQRENKFPGISYSELLKTQFGKCAICGVDESDYRKESGKKFAIDHDHKTLKVRGLLCCKCNRGIGYLQDSIKNLESAIKYLEQ